MVDNKDYDALLYLNSERIKVNKSKELFIGKKFSKYANLIKNYVLLVFLKNFVMMFMLFLIKMFVIII